MSEKISGVISTLNEEANIVACIASMAGVDEVVVADDGSTDHTVELARSMGAKVYRRKDWSTPVEQADVDAFTARFDWAPAFKAGDRIRNGHLESREAHSFASHDWHLALDADERATWDIDKIHDAMAVSDHIESDFVHCHDEAGNPTRVSTITKLFKMSMTEISGRTHTAVILRGRTVHSESFRIDHYQAPGHTQSYVLPILEYSVLKDDDQRSRFYLGREYYYAHQYDHALSMLDLYLVNADWIKEIAQARLYKARCLWEDGSGRGDEARKECLEAVLLNPEHREALALMSELYHEPWSHKWAHLAACATDEDILF
jgi:glycosyltransferase involved in cell wall biosynthesis